MINRYDYESPIGKLGILEEDGKLVGLFRAAQNDTAVIRAGRIGMRIGQAGIRGGQTAVHTDSSVIQKTVKQLEEYFQGKRTVFELPVCLKGTPFQQKVWAALQTIPYGETRSYGELAAQIGNPKACRAIGGANHRNPVMIVVPCHRVIGADGSLTGFGCGLDAKQYLLELERRNGSEK